MQINERQVWDTLDEGTIREVSDIIMNGIRTDISVKEWLIGEWESTHIMWIGELSPFPPPIKGVKVTDEHYVKMKTFYETVSHDKVFMYVGHGYDRKRYGHVIDRKLAEKLKTRLVRTIKHADQ